MTKAPERIWISTDRKGRNVYCDTDAHVKPCDEVRSAYNEYWHINCVEKLKSRIKELEGSAVPVVPYVSRIPPKK